MRSSGSSPDPWVPRSHAQIWGDLQRVASRTPGFKPAEHMARILSGRAQVFPLPSGSVVGIMRRDGVAHLTGGAGNLDEILDAEASICQFYAARGASRLTLSGRRGWLRALGPLGWRREGDRLIKDLRANG